MSRLTDGASSADSNERSPLLRYLERLEERGDAAAVDAFAKRVETSARYLYVIARGEKAPRPRLMRNIFRETGGRVTYRQLVEASPGLDSASRAGRSTILEARAQTAKAARRTPKRQGSAESARRC